MSEKMKIFDDVANTIIELKSIDELKELLIDAISKDISVVELVEKGLRKGLDVVGEKYEAGEYFLAELSYAADLATDALEVLKPQLEKVKMEKKGAIVLGTVLGDIHDIGKNIVSMLMICRGWEVHDVGVDVPPERFIEEVKKVKPDILGMTSLLTTTTHMFGETIDKLKEEGIRDEIKVMVGGNAATEEVANRYGADGFTTSAEEGIRKCEEWMRK